MPHPLVAQLHFARSEFVRGLAGLSDEEASRRIGPMNSISWMIGHLAWQEQRYWLWRAQDKILLPAVNEMFASGGPATTPPLQETWAWWRTIVDAAEPWLDALTQPAIEQPLQAGFSNVGTFMLRTTYHYWYHLGEALAARQVLGHTGLPDFVGDIDEEAPYVAEKA